MLKNTLAISTLFFLASAAHADLPLSLEGIAPEQNCWETGLSLSYYNRNHTSPQQGKSLYFATPQNTLIEIPASSKKVATTATSSTPMPTCNTA
ncbi:MAG: hypothetical protein Q4D61_00965 [Cardiobacteriaceae bacterium]|nr:hypothetical protein [Cardiobacteriaceae bacterium]